jgi:hypothetical protein
MNLLKCFIIHIGMGTYNGVWEHLYYRYVKGGKYPSESSELIPDAEETKPTEVYVAPDKEPLN